MKLYIDDEREAPPGWVQAFNFKEAIETIVENAPVITHIDFDFFLSDHPGMLTGEDLIRELSHIQYLEGVKIFHQPRHHYTCHSSDDFYNQQMNKRLDKIFGINESLPSKQPQLERLRKSKGRR